MKHAKKSLLLVLGLMSLGINCSDRDPSLDEPISSNERIEQARAADCIVVTSVAGLNNLCQLIGGDTVKDKQLVVVSKRIKQHAVALGFQQVMIADDANDNAVMQKVRDGAKR